MSYFDIQLGARPGSPDGKEELPPPISPALFGATAGARPDHHAGDITPSAASPASAAADGAAPTALACPLCGGAMRAEHGVLICTGRCAARWIEDLPGRLVDIAALPYGICVCCPRPRPLVRGARGAVCPESKSEYVLLPDGPRLLAKAAPNGLCLCCAPPAPLIYRDGALICQAKPSMRYQRINGTTHLLKTADAATRTLAAIDEALRRNAAQLTVNGVFVFDD